MTSVSGRTTPRSGQFLRGAFLDREFALRLLTSIHSFRSRPIVWYKNLDPLRYSISKSPNHPFIVIRYHVQTVPQLPQSPR